MAKKRSVYVAGAMSGLPNLNYGAFFKKATELKRDGWTVVNPADKEYKGVKTTHRENGEVQTEWTDELSPMFYHKVIFRDFEMVRACDAIYMMRGWEKSSGASCELAVAKYHNKEIIFEVKTDKQMAYTRKSNFKVVHDED